MKLHALELAVIVAYFATVILRGLWASRRGSKDLDAYFLGGMVLARALACVRHVRHRGHDVDGLHPVRQWRQEHLAAVPVAGVQPDFPDDVPERVAAALERHDRRRWGETANRYVVDPGAYRIAAGPASEQLLLKTVLRVVPSK
jgi:hypothetical protein